MRLLLDTHTVFWWLLAPHNLSTAACDAIETSDVVFVSAATALEMATKFRIGKWHEVKDLAQNFSRHVADEDFVELPITVAHAALAGSIVSGHKDPFDRLLAAQAILENLSILSVDAQLTGLGARVVW